MTAKTEAIESVMWRTIKILGTFDAGLLHGNVCMTHACSRVRITRYLNQCAKRGLLHKTGAGQYRIAAHAPAAAPVFRRLTARERSGEVCAL